MIRAPFPYFGGKANAAPMIWDAFDASTLGNFVEPFLGSAAVYLNRPDTFTGWATLNDLNGHVANFWRAVKAKPQEVAEAADSIIHECDLHAKHLWLVRNDLSSRLMADPYFHDPKAAGWWAWGCCLWIGSGWCAGDGAWTEVDGEFVNQRQLPHLGGGRGICGKRSSFILQWMDELSERLRDARIACGDWERICAPNTMTRNGPCAVLLDPPYSQTKSVYASDSNTVAHDVREWCIKNGGNPLLRIALCGHDTEHNELAEKHGWTVETWDKPGGYQGADDRERIWFSPACVLKRQKQDGLFS